VLATRELPLTGTHAMPREKCGTLVEQSLNLEQFHSGGCQMKRFASAPLDQWSVAWRTVPLMMAWLWAGAVVTFYCGYHFAQPSSPWMVTNGRTYYTHPPAQTLAQSDHVSAEIVTLALALGVGVGTLDLVVRLVRRMTAPGMASLSAGGILVLFSLFGLLRGLAGIGTAGLLVILSGLPMKSTATVDPAPSAPPSAPASWYADPTGRHDVRYWDGAAWSSHVADAGRPTTDAG